MRSLSAAASLVSTMYFEIVYHSNIHPIRQPGDSMSVPNLARTVPKFVVLNLSAHWKNLILWTKAGDKLCD